MAPSLSDADYFRTPLQNPEESYSRLLELMDFLRVHCSYDRRQTFDSLRALSIEEVYELSDAIIQKDQTLLLEELADLQFHLVFYGKIAEETNMFNSKDVLDFLREKLVRRHMHLFQEERETPSWEEIKRREKPIDTSYLSGISKGLPALEKAMRIQHKAREAGFDWDHPHEVWEKVEEELAEFKEHITEHSLTEASFDNAEAEFGDVLFSLVNYARFLGIDPDKALERTNQKFIHRFTYLEKAALSEGKSLKSMSLEEMEVHWQAAKKK